MVAAWLPFARRVGSPAAAPAAGDIESPGIHGPDGESSDVDRRDFDSRDMLQHAIEVARDGMAIFDRDLKLVAWNRAYRELFHFPETMLVVGVTLDELTRFNAARGLYGAGALEDLFTARMDLLRRPSANLRLEYERLGRVLEMRSVRLRNGGLFFTYSDATAQAKSEEQNEAQRQLLERRVRERTEDLESLNLELARAKAEAEDANISKTRFLAAASHDLLQPLNAARLYATSLSESLRHGCDGDETRRLAANVDNSLEAVEDILAALLEISQLDAGATRVEIAPVDLDTLFRRLAIDFAPAAAKRGLRLRIVPSSLTVVSDRRLLRRTLQNLVSNALKYSTRGGVLIGARRCGEGRVRLDVVDTGCGIPAAKQRLIFREFERLPTGPEQTPGAGLGLSIVERLAHVLGHEIGVTSKVGRGSRFSITVSRSTTEPFGPVLPMPTVQRQRSLEGLVVAAVDNEVSILRGMQALLRGWDCDVATGTDLAGIGAALAELGLAPDVIVADHHLGGATDGLDVIAALRLRHGPVPAVLITADRSAALRALAGRCGVRMLTKPLKPAALRSLLSQWRLLRPEPD